MAKDRRICFSDADCSILPGDNHAIIFSKTVCLQLQELVLPEWVKLGRVLFADNGSFDNENGGPTLGTPIRKFNHIHYIFPSHIVVGFQFEANHSKQPAVLIEKWSKLESQLRKATGMKYENIVPKSKWPRLQFRHYNTSLDLEDREERRLLVHNTRTALEVAANVFNW